MAIVTFMLLPVMTIAATGIAIGALIKRDEQLATIASFHSAALALAQIACWFVV